MRETRGRIVITLLALAASVALAAGPLPKLPADRALPQTGDSPGPVTFSHRAHLDESAPDCLVCHSGLFSLLGRTGSRVDSGIRHAAMERGRQCGACHAGGLGAEEVRSPRSPHGTGAGFTPASEPDRTRATALDDCAHCHTEK